MCESVDRSIAEIARRFRNLSSISQKFSILVPANFLNESFLCDLEDHAADLDAVEFSLERKRISSFLAACGGAAESDLVRGSPLELLEFIFRWRLESSVPNAVVLSCRHFEIFRLGPGRHLTTLRHC